MDTVVYLVFDPNDTLAAVPKDRPPGKFGGHPCAVSKSVAWRVISLQSCCTQILVGATAVSAMKITTPEPSQYLVRIRFATQRAAFVLALSAFSSFGAHADEKTGTTTQTTQFDGLWQTTLSCTNASGALGYSFRFPSTVKNGVLHGEKGTAHEAGWLQIDGSVHPDGVADLYVEGLVGAAPFAVGQRPAGTPYGYHVEGRFSLEHAEGHRVEGRPCTVVWIREK